MPAKSDANLFDLIKSLSKKEKAELDKHHFHDKKGTKYFKIYQFIDKKQDEYDEKAVIHACEIEPSKYPGLKNYLYNLILNHLEVIQADEVENFTLLGTITRAHVLKNKGLFKQCLKLIEKGIKSAELKENYLALLQLYELRDQVRSRFTGDFKKEEDIHVAFDEVLKAYDNYFDTAYYRYCLFKSIIPSLQGVAFEDITSGLMHRDPRADTTIKEVLKLRYLSRKELSLRNFDKILEYNDGLFELMGNPNKNKKLPLPWIAGFYTTRITVLINVKN